MLKIKEGYGKDNLHGEYDYILENGVMLFSQDWNGEAYIRALNIETNEWNNNTFKAVYRFQQEEINIEELEENSPEWQKATEIIGFEEW